MNLGTTLPTIKDLKKIWKKIRGKGRIVNCSSKPLWVIEADAESGNVVAHLLPPMTKSPTDVDIDAFRRVDKKPVDGHSYWRKFYNFSTLEVFDNGNDLKVSVIKKIAVDEKYFNQGKIAYDRSASWVVPIKLITDVRRGKNRRITKYHISDVGWLKPAEALAMTCKGEIDNARPVFPSTGKPFIRTLRDRQIFNICSPAQWICGLVFGLK